MGNKLADLLLDSEIADAKRLAGQRDRAYQEGFQAGALAMREAAAKVADAYADTNIEMAGDSVLTDPLLRGEALTAENVKMSEKLMVEGCVHSSMFHAAQNIRDAISCIDPATLKGE